MQRAQEADLLLFGEQQEQVSAHQGTVFQRRLSSSYVLHSEVCCRPSCRSSSSQRVRHSTTKAL
jgi:hypothetical protein